MSMLLPQIPREPRPGQRPEATTIIQIIRCLRFILARLQITPSPGGRRGSEAPFTPWQIEDASSGGALKVTVGDGFVTPVNMPGPYSPVTLGGVSLATIPAPTLVVTESVRILLKRVATEGDSTRSFVDTIVSDPLTNPTQPVDVINPDDWTCYVLLGRVYVTSGAISSITQDQTRNLYVENYGATNEALATS